MPCILNHFINFIKNNMQIIDGVKIKDEILNKLKSEVDALPFPPIFCDILVGDDTVSASYVRIKGKMAESIGVKFKAVNFPENTTTEEILQEIDNLNKVPLLCGIIIQLPLPPQIDKQLILDRIDPKLDVDCLGSYNSEIFYNIGGGVGYPTALACMRILDSLNLDLKEKGIVVVGQGRLVGLPVSHMLRSRGLEIKTINSKTENSDEIIKNADIVITATGRAKSINENNIKEGVVIIDAGTSEENGAVVGDVDLDSVITKALYVSKTPGGVGPVTVAMLLDNVYQVAKIKLGGEN